MSISIIFSSILYYHSYKSLHIRLDYLWFAFNNPHQNDDHDHDHHRRHHHDNREKVQKGRSPSVCRLHNNWFDCCLHSFTIIYLLFIWRSQIKWLKKQKQLYCRDFTFPKGSFQKSFINSQNEKNPESLVEEEERYSQYFDLVGNVSLLLLSACVLHLCQPECFDILSCFDHLHLIFWRFESDLNRCTLMIKLVWTYHDISLLWMLAIKLLEWRSLN